MDTRSEHGQYWPGNRTGGGETQTPADNGKVDRVDLGTLPADATASEMRTAIRNIQNAMRPLATAIAAALCGFAMAQSAAWDRLKGGAPVVTNEQDTAAMAKIVSATNALRESIEPKIALAETALQPGATNGIPETLAGHGTRLDALEEAAADRPDMSLYALRSEVPPAVDLAPYATTADMQGRLAEAASNTATQIEGLRTETAGKVAAATNGLPEKIAAATNGIPARIAAATNGLPEKIAAATNGVPETIAEHDAEIARLSRAIEASMDSNTTYRLMTPEGDVYQDATGIVWRTESFQVPGHFRFQKLEYHTNGVYQAETNAMPEGIYWETWEGFYQEGEVGYEIFVGRRNETENVESCYREWIAFTNQVDAADMDTAKFYYGVVLEIAGEWTDLIETNQYIGAAMLRIEWPMSAHTNMTRYLVFARTNVTATITTPIDRVLYASATQYAMTTNDVQNIVTNEKLSSWIVLREGIDVTSQLAQPEWRYFAHPNIYGWSRPILPGEQGENNYPAIVTAGTGYDATGLLWVGEDPGSFQGFEYTATRTSVNALGLARLEDLPPLTNGLASEESVSAANSRAVNAQNTANAASNTAANVASTVTAWETYWDGDEVRVTVTNYYGSQDIPSLYLEEKIENTNAYRVVWDERTRWRTNEVQMAELRSAIDSKADRAWGYYESHTGEYAPDGYTWLSSPRIAIAGGLAYQRTLTTSGAVFVLASNGLVAETGGDPTNGFFRIKDDEGNTTFEIVRGNKRTVGATAAGIKVESSGGTNTITIPYNVVSEASPTLYGTTDLASGEWTQLSPTWTGQSGAWTGTVTTASSTYFVKGEYETGGETYIRNAAPISVESGIYCTDGIHKVRPVYSNGAITWELVTQ